jgi:hypothetical protein
VRKVTNKMVGVMQDRAESNIDALDQIGDDERRNEPSRALAAGGGWRVAGQHSTRNLANEPSSGFPSTRNLTNEPSSGLSPTRNSQNEATIMRFRPGLPLASSREKDGDWPAVLTGPAGRIPRKAAIARPGERLSSASNRQIDGCGPGFPAWPPGRIERKNRRETWRLLAHHHLGSADFRTPKAFHSKAQGRAAHPGNASAFRFPSSPAHPNGIPHLAAPVRLGSELWNPLGVQAMRESETQGAPAVTLGSVV